MGAQGALRHYNASDDVVDSSTPSRCRLEDHRRPTPATGSASSASTVVGVGDRGVGEPCTIDNERSPDHDPPPMKARTVLVATRYAGFAFSFGA